MTDHEIIEDVLRRLKERGVEVYISSCGCCNSPWVKIRIDGVMVLDVDGETVGDEDTLKK